MFEIKPCPFCGNETNEENFFSCDGYPKACGCWEKTHSAQEAVNVWNTRPIDNKLRALLQEWVEAWEYDILEVRANGNTCQGQDEGLVRGREVMADIMSKTMDALK